jgi:hypothetical protein
MVDANSNDSEQGNEVDDIRRILFGDQMTAVWKRFSQMEKSIEQLQSENNNLRRALEIELKSRVDSNQEIKKQAEISDQELKNLIEISSQELKKQMEGSFKERDEKGDANRSDQVELSNSLQKALEQYKSKIA